MAEMVEWLKRNRLSRHAKAISRAAGLYAFETIDRIISIVGLILMSITCVFAETRRRATCAF